MNFQARLAATYAAWLALTCAAVLGLGYWGVERLLARELDGSLVAIADYERAHYPAVYPTFGDGRAKVGPCVFHLGTDGAVLYRSVAANPPAGRFSDAFLASAQAHANAFADADSPMGPLRVLVAWVDDGSSPVRMIEVAAPLAPIRHELAAIGAWLAALAAAAVALSVPIGLALARRGLAPVRAVIDVARRTDGRTPGVRAVPGAADVELGSLGEAFNGMLGRLEEALERQERFTADASHELRSPLTALRVGIEVALRRERSTSAYQETLVGALDEIERLERLTSDLLALSKLDQGAVSAGSTCDLAALARAALAANLPAGADWRYEGPATGAWVAAPAESVERILTNLLANVRAHAPGATARLTLVATAQAVSLAVEDDGPGIPPEALPRVFDRFYRADAARSTRGAGLGLAIARQAAEAFGGTLRAEGTATGARFVLGLPVPGAVPVVALDELAAPRV